jgi:hypothetical protein
VNIFAPGFLVALVLLVPVLVAFLVRRQRHTVRVPSTMIWRLGARSVAKSRRIRDVRRFIALLACLGGVAALVVAAARPTGRRGDMRIFVVDGSASMAEAPLAEARRWLRREVAAMGPNARVAIVLAASEARVLVPPSAPGPLVEDAIGSLTAERDVAAIDEAVVLAEGLAGGGPASVVILSDRSVDVPEPSRARATKLTLHVVSRSAPDNLGITGLFTRTPGEARDDEEREAVISVGTSSKSARRAHLVLTLGGRLVADRRLDVPAQSEVTEHIGLRGAGHLVAHVSADDGRGDASAIDDEAELDEVVRRPPRVALVTGSADGSATRFFVERAIRATGVTDVSVVAPGEEIPPRAEVAVVLGDGPAPPVKVPAFFLGAAPPATQTRNIAKTETHLRAIATEDALLRGVAIDDLTTLRAKVATPPRGARGVRTLIDLDGGPTLIAGGAGVHAWVWLGIDLDASDLVLHVAFPVLVGNVLTELGGASQVVTAKTVPPSEVTDSSSTAAQTLERAPEPKWRIPASPATVIALVGAMLLALEAWLTFRRRWAST